MQVEVFSENITVKNAGDEPPANQLFSTVINCNRNLIFQKFNAEAEPCAFGNNHLNQAINQKHNQDSKTQRCESVRFSD